MPGIYIETYGCQMNVSDSELMLGVLGREGYVRMDDPAQADVVLVNTCAVRDHAEQKVLSRMGELKRLKRPGSVLGVVGCMAQRLGPRLLERVPQVDLVVGPDGYRGLPELIARARAGERTAEVVFKRWEHYEDIAPVRGGAVSAFVTVQRGCDYRCTFCIVPMTRGPERSRRFEDVVREVTDLASGGTTEVTLLGQTVNSYDDGTHDFADLLRAVGGIPGVRRLRFTSPYPTDFTDGVVAAMAETPAVCEHVHLPVQSGPSRAAATSPWWAAHTKCWSRGAPSGVSCCRAAPAPTRWRSSRAPTPGSAGIATSASRARPGRPSRPCRSGGWGGSSPSWGDERDARGGTAGVREAASPATPVLRLRHVPRRRPRIRAQSPRAELRIYATGRSVGRAATRQRSGKGQAGRGAARGVRQGGARAALRGEAGAADLIR